MWEYEVIQDGRPPIPLHTFDPRVRPVDGPPPGMAGPTTETTILEDGTGISRFGASAGRPRVIALRFVVVGANANDHALARQALATVMYSTPGDYQKYLRLGQIGSMYYYTPPYVVESVTDEPTGPYASEVTYRLLCEDWHVKGVSGTGTLAHGVTAQGLMLYRPYGASDLPIASGATDWTWVEAAAGDFWCFRHGGEVRRYNTAGVLIGTSTIPATSVQQARLFDGTGSLIARGSSAAQLYAWNGSVWIAWGPTVSGGTINEIYPDGNRLIVAGSFTSPRKGVMELDGTGAVVSPEIFPTATTIDITGVWGGESMRLYAGAVNGDTRVWFGKTGQSQPYVVAALDNAWCKFAGSAFSNVYLATTSAAIGNAPSGRLVRVRQATSFEPVGEGLVANPRYVVLSGGDLYVACATTPGYLYRIYKGGLQILATANGPIRCAARVGNVLCVVGGFNGNNAISGISRLQTATSCCGIGVGIANDLLSAWVRFDQDAWARNMMVSGDGTTLPDSAYIAGSGTDWLTHQQPLSAGDTVYVVGRHTVTNIVVLPFTYLLAGV